MDIGTLLAQAEQAAAAYRHAIAANASARIRKGEAKLALETAKDEITLALDTPEALKAYGSNAEQRAARLALDTAALAAELRESERAVIMAETKAEAEERQAGIQAELVGHKVKIAVILARV